MFKFQRRHFSLIATKVAAQRATRTDFTSYVNRVAEALKATNVNFNKQRFVDACNGEMRGVDKASLNRKSLDEGRVEKFLAQFERDAGFRVEIPAYADAWMQGDRFGEVVKRIPADRSKDELCDTYEVKLDKSGRHRRYIADECRMV